MSVVEESGVGKLGEGKMRREEVERKRPILKCDMESSVIGYCFVPCTLTSTA
jgi:hypothetical protein